MRPSLLLARGLALAAALFMALPMAAATPAKRAKGKRTTPAAADYAPTTQESEAKAKPEVPASLPAPVEEPAPAPAAEPPSATNTTRPSTADASLADSGNEREGNQLAEATLAQREAARIATGRTEVGVSVSVDVGSRRFRFNDEVGARLRPYKLPIAPMLSFGLEAYPLAASNVPVLRDLGFRGRVSRAFAVDSTTPEGSTIDTHWTRFGGDVRERLLIPGRHALEFGAFVGMDASYFSMSSRSHVAALLPSARTLAVRFGLDARILVAGRFSVLVDAAYLAVTTPGAIYDRFRDPSLAGVDGSLGCAVALIPGLEARLNARYTRYFASFEPKVGDSIVAGGALDELFQAGLGVRYAH